MTKWTLQISGLDTKEVIKITQAQICKDFEASNSQSECKLCKAYDICQEMSRTPIAEMHELDQINIATRLIMASPNVVGGVDVCGGTIDIDEKTLCAPRDKIRSYNRRLKAKIKRRNLQ